MVPPESDIQVRRWELEKSYKSSNWRDVIDLCDNLGIDLTNVELSYKIRSLYMLKEYQRCFDICNDGQEYDKSLLFNICRFQLRSAIALDNKELLFELNGLSAIQVAPEIVPLLLFELKS